MVYRIGGSTQLSGLVIVRHTPLQHLSLNVVIVEGRVVKPPLMADPTRGVLVHHNILHGTLRAPHVRNVFADARASTHLTVSVLDAELVGVVILNDGVDNLISN